MTTYNRATLKTFFETGDVPTGTNYADLIDSCLNIVDTGTQSIAGTLNPTELVTARVSAGNGKFTSGVEIQGNLSAARLFVSTSVHTSALDMRGGRITNVSAVYHVTGIISALGTTQATAAPLTFEINRGAGVADGVTTGFLLLANQTGRVQYLFNSTASANLYPCTGGQINALSSNAAFGLTANTLYTIVHTLASGYAVK